ncbi:acetolactate synthase large subunit [Agathobaculum butyriciproducens]|uniref:biosynthetic-type acetolactate synthase large subunit n=1 Tax=Agathobaculum butyriciproducens TaxID=1628085 RepID=UPI000D5C4FBB|nr:MULTISPECIES: biosynthetic-type acetolactate synthase large subunit [unclassified Butyricicoccus]PVY46535.1 acetolactate synthase large subunit [Agathobaculum butyriciproducens]RGM79251.1 biosynthetic-type acetolactate synthase large subunit [Butyricicoccus sp. OM06-6AC]RHQ83321.1 biosynthetic-type acetolactate synthase large subunit [Butyricicoccus sp. AF22-28AC]RHR89979.1 biosynthetic-type acetolactate synthase large subunit [Butyricicoccus sp. AF15-40]
MVKNGAEILIDALVEQGVDTIFGYPGGAVLNIYDALYKNSDRIRHILTAHEQGAAHAADGYARATGKVGVCLATSGPGATNLVTGIATAYMDSIPMVAITGNVGTSLIGRDSFQEVYIAGITMPITKHNFVVRDVDELADTVRDAFRIAASGRPGPVLIDIPKDITAAKCEFIPKGKVEINETYEISDEELQTVADMIAASERPMIYYGGGVETSDAGDMLLQLQRKADIPSAHTMMAIGCIPDTEPLSLGMIGMHGTVSAAWAVERCDLLVCIGARFSDRVATNTKRFAPSAKVIHVDIDNAEINKNIGVDYAIVSDAETFLEKVMPYIKEAKHDAWRAQIAEWQTKLDYVPKDDESVIHPHQLLRTVAEETPEDTIIATDVGQHQLWSAQYNGRKHVRQFLTSGGLGTMGFGYGAALGAQVAFPDRTVVHITGDGSFHMNLNEICTAVSYNLPVITIIMNNRVLGNVRQWQTMFYGSRYSQTDPHRKTDYVKLADAFGARGFRVSNIAELRDALREAMKRTGPVLIDAQIDKDERVLPMIPAGGTVDDLVTE